jgi:hypothetical protein
MLASVLAKGTIQLSMIGLEIYVIRCYCSAWILYSYIDNDLLFKVPGTRCMSFPFSLSKLVARIYHSIALY